jgi:hypothetical protein
MALLLLLIADYACKRPERPVKRSRLRKSVQKDTGRRTIWYDGLLFPPEQSFDKQILWKNAPPASTFFKKVRFLGFKTTFQGSLSPSLSRNSLQNGSLSAIGDVG